eukprot:1162148-Pelagomonas_calceolata.AAC.3
MPLTPIPGASWKACQFQGNITCTRLVANAQVLADVEARDKQAKEAAAAAAAATNAAIAAVSTRLSEMDSQVGAVNEVVMIEEGAPPVSNVARGQMLMQGQWTGGALGWIAQQRWFRIPMLYRSSRAKDV